MPLETICADFLAAAAAAVAAAQPNSSAAGGRSASPPSQQGWQRLFSLSVHPPPTMSIPGAASLLATKLAGLPRLGTLHYITGPLSAWLLCMPPRSCTFTLAVRLQRATKDWGPVAPTGRQRARNGHETTAITVWFQENPRGPGWHSAHSSHLAARAAEKERKRGGGAWP
jgi:hypothetical protein